MKYHADRATRNSLKTGVNSVASEGRTVLAPHLTPFVLL